MRAWHHRSATITGDIPAGKSGLDPAAFYRWKAKLTWVHSVMGKVQFEFTVTN